MKTKIFLCLSILVFVFACVGGETADAKRCRVVIFDTDIGNSTDDLFALDVLYKMADFGLADIKGIVVSRPGYDYAALADIENTYYSKSDINAFEARALKLTKKVFDETQVRNGVSLINTLKDATKKEGSILKIVSFAHSSENGIYLDYDEGFYSTLTFSPDKHYANVDMLVKEVSKGNVKFETDAVWIFASCNTARGYKNSLNPLALNVALKLNITTIGSTGPVYPEIIKGKETGRLKTDGTFKKFEPYEESVSREIVKEHSFLFFRWTSTEKVTSTVTKVKVTDLGDTIDPSEY